MRTATITRVHTVGTNRKYNGIFARLLTKRSITSKTRDGPGARKNRDTQNKDTTRHYISDMIYTFIKGKVLRNEAQSD